MGATDEILLVGIDVGMTCTGVAYSITAPGLQMVDPYTIQDWPGNSQSADKVPTTVCFRDGRVTSWGFLTRKEPDQAMVHEWFKTFFDVDVYNKHRQANPDQVPSRHSDVRRYYKGFLSKLYLEIKIRLEDRVSNWENAKIEFLFSVPTTWTKIGLTRDFRELAKEAGFGQDSRNHLVDVSLTEAEAAACHTFTSQSAVYRNGDIILVVDAGGGTTDLALLRVHREGSVSLEPLDEVHGDEIGSVEIDLGFFALVEERLPLVAQELGMSIDAMDRLATRMVREKFRSIKEDFGKSDGDERDLDIKVEMPGVSDTFTSQRNRIFGGKMYFQRAEIQRLFDQQLSKMYPLIEGQMDRMPIVAPGDQITQIVLSGGLGSSHYIRARLRQRYAEGSRHQFAPDVRIMTSLRPQLAVVKGLVQDRMQRLKLNGGIIGPSKSRQSLGVIVNQLYNPSIHRGEELMEDPIDGMTYAKNQISWFIKQGETINQEYIEKKFYRTFRPTDSRQVWESRIAICNNRSAELPRSLRGDGVKPLCTMRSDLTHVPLSRFEKKQVKWFECWKSFETHYKASYDIRFVLKPAHIDCELWFQGVQYGGANFEVQWEEGAFMAAPRQAPRESLDRQGWRE